LKEKNTELAEQVAALTAQLANAAPSSGESRAAPANTDQAALLLQFQEIMAKHTTSLEKGYAAQQQAACARQRLLDGLGTETFAQVVRKFNPQHAKYDIKQSDSLITPYRAESKVPFSEELRVGKTEKACQAAPLERIAAETHHEFGSYYGYWIIEYTYQNGQWTVNKTLTEKNRALYDEAFRKGSPDSAKFRIDTKLFPEFE